MWRSNAGFSLLEVILSISLIAVLAGISLPIYRGFQLNNQLDVAADMIAETSRRAQLLSQVGDRNSAHGIYIGSGELVMFTGASYAGRQGEYDETFALADQLELTGLSEIVFAELTGLPNSAGTIEITALNNATRSLNVSALGVIEY